MLMRLSKDPNPEIRRRASSLFYNMRKDPNGHFGTFSTASIVNDRGKAQKADSVRFKGEDYR